MPLEKVGIGVVGLGTVGAAVVKGLRRNRRIVFERCGANVEVRKVAEVDSAKLRAAGVPARIRSRDYREVLNDPEIQIVVEVVGGTGVAREIVLGALRARKHVVTANKALLATHWREIFSLADEQKCAVGIEASVMAGVPVIRTIEEGLGGNVIHSLVGILNGTSNFVLTRMATRGMNFSRALAEARKKGLCEANASLDIDGYDAAQKLSILGSLALGKWLPPADVHREGIGHLERDDIISAQSDFGYVIRPLAIFKKLPSAVDARVHPAFVPESHPLAAIQDEFNAVVINADNAGPLTLAGKGAGAKPAASGVISDIISLARTIHQSGGRAISAPPRLAGDSVRVARLEEIESKFYIRFSVVDRPGVLSWIAGVLGKHGVSIATCHQRGRSANSAVPVIMVTHQAKEGAVRKALSQIDSAGRIVKRRTAAIRIEE